MEGNEPINPIAKEAVNVWRISALITHGIIILVFVILIWASHTYDWYTWIPIVLWVLIALDIISVIWDTGIEPVISQKRWRFGISGEFVSLKHGIFQEVNIMIPMTKVQFVKVEQGPLLRQYNLYTLSIGTLGETHDIPMLPEQEALNLRGQIANNAKIKEVE